MKWIEDLIPQADASWSNNHNKLCQLIKNNLADPKYGVEIGVAFGLNSFKLLNNFKNLNLYSIDPYIKYSDQDKMSDLVEDIKGDQLYDFVSKRLKNEFKNRSIFIRGTSQDLDQEPDKFFDFIYIDGDHTYQGTNIDLINSFPKIKKNGILCGDDYGVFEHIDFGVRKAVDEFCLKNNLKLNIDESFWWVIK